MAQSTKTNRVTVAGTVTPELFDFIDNEHWKLRKTRSEVVGDVLLDWAKAQGFKPADAETGEVTAENADETPADTDETPADAEQGEGATVVAGRAKATRAK